MSIQRAAESRLRQSTLRADCSRLRLFERVRVEQRKELAAHLARRAAARMEARR